MSQERESLLGVEDMIIDKVTVPQWKRDVFYRTLSIEEQAKWEESISSGGSDGKAVASASAQEVMAKLLVQAVCDKDGKLIFQADDWKALVGKNSQAVKTVYDAICLLNGIGEKGRKSLEGNSKDPANASS